MEFRKLKADEIEIRIGSVGEKGVSLLLYQDARCAMTILDETVGAENWQRDHKDVKGNLFCGIGIKCDGEWIWKWDCGTESYTEKEKGESSDSMKRAAVNWGIARELYTSPFIFIKGVTEKNPEGKAEITADGKKKLNGIFVSEISYNEKGAISHLVICDKDGERIFSWGQENKRIKQEKKNPEQLLADDRITPGGVDYIENLIRETKSDTAKLLAFYKIKSLAEMSVKQAEHCIKALEAKLG